MTTRNYSKLPGLNHRLVLEFDRGRVREMLLAVGLSALLLLPLLLYVWQTSEWIRSGYRTEQLKTQRDRLLEVNQQLRLEKASLESLGRIEQVAGDQLGLTEPPNGTVVLVDTNRTRPPKRPTPGGIASTRTIVQQGSHDPDATGSRTAN